MEPQVFRMLYVVTVNDRSHPALADLIFDGERPFAVLAWSKGVEQRYPLIAVPLDRSDLTNFNGDEIDYVYRRALHSLDS